VRSDHDMPAEAQKIRAWSRSIAIFAAKDVTFQGAKPPASTYLPNQHCRRAWVASRDPAIWYVGLKVIADLLFVTAVGVDT
jgi:hypothetical protein